MEQSPTPARLLTGLTTFLHEGRTYVGLLTQPQTGPWMEVVDAIELRFRMSEQGAVSVIPQPILPAAGPVPVLRLPPCAHWDVSTDNELIHSYTDATRRRSILLPGRL